MSFCWCLGYDDFETDDDEPAIVYYPWDTSPTKCFTLMIVDDDRREMDESLTITLQEEASSTIMLVFGAKLVFSPEYVTVTIQRDSRYSTCLHFLLVPACDTHSSKYHLAGVIEESEATL